MKGQTGRYHRPNEIDYGEDKGECIVMKSKIVLRYVPVDKEISRFASSEDGFGDPGVSATYPKDLQMRQTSAQRAPSSVKHITYLR
jgi:hypothetical protein